MDFAADSQAFYSLSQVVSEAVLITQGQGVIFANRAACRIFGCGAEEIRGRDPGTLLATPPDQESPEQPVNFVSRVTTRDGLGPLVSGCCFRMDHDTTLWVLKDEETMADMGAMAAGLIHNLTGPLSVIRSGAEMLARCLERTRQQAPELTASMDAWPASARNACQTSMDNVDQITDAARDLLAKLRGDAARQQVPLDLNEILKREVSLLDNDLTIKHSIAKRLTLDDSLPRLAGLYSDFSHSFRNLLRNAIQAMNDSPVKELDVATAFLPDEDQIEVRISDSGHGVPAELQKRIFEPFFTTRAEGGHSSGLGLHSVRQLLMPYQVRIDLNSEPGGTAFILRIPLGERRTQ
jgi:two-component system, NtrC family, sensor kinase